MWVRVGLILSHYLILAILFGIILHRNFSCIFLFIATHLLVPPASGQNGIKSNEQASGGTLSSFPFFLGEYWFHNLFFVTDATKYWMISQKTLLKPLNHLTSDWSPLYLFVIILLINLFFWWNCVSFLLLLLLGSFFYISFSWWSFPGVRVTTSFLMSPGLFLVFWAISII